MKKTGVKSEFPWNGDTRLKEPRLLNHNFLGGICHLKKNLFFYLFHSILKIGFSVSSLFRDFVTFQILTFHSFFQIEKVFSYLFFDLTNSNVNLKDLKERLLFRYLKSFSYFLNLVCSIWKRGKSKYEA